MNEDQLEPQVETEERSEWTVPVLDAVQLKPLDLIVAAVGGRVVVIPPNAAGYVVPRQSNERYCQALRTANNVAAHQILVSGMDAER